VQYSGANLVDGAMVMRYGILVISLAGRGRAEICTQSVLYTAGTALFYAVQNGLQNAGVTG
jgi:hypothetical protein